MAININIPDIYFDERYPKLSQKIENGCADSVKVETSDGVIISYFIKRKIPIDIGFDYYDIVTPYGYGGPYIARLDGDKSRLISCFEEAMRSYVSKNSVVSEFVRFHPIIGNALDFKKIYDSKYDRHTLATNLKNYSIEEEFGKSAKKCIRKAIEMGVSFDVIEGPNEIDDFLDIYYSTMKRDNATEFYYFDREYFDAFLREFSKNIIYVRAIFNGKVIAAGFYFHYGKIIESHLSGTLSEYLYLSPAYVVKFATAKWAKEKGIEYIHYGGGTNKDESNSLYLFKSKFAQNTKMDFYIGKKIWNEEIYRKLCDIRDINSETDYFPAYRSR